jgi:hypothetical protein
MKRGSSAKSSIFQQASFILCLVLSLLGSAKPTSTLDSALRTVSDSLAEALEKAPRMEMTLENEKDDILVVFSDLDGTLIHYPDKIPGTKGLLKLPPSATGMRGIISSKTLAQIQDIGAKGIKFVLVSGMRTSTFLSRVPYLPRADAYCTESGGRIFYPTSENYAKNAFKVTPKKYDGATEEDLKPFGLVEDLEWRALMEKTAGPFGSASLNDIAADPTKVPDINQRDGLLWDFARDLKAKGFEVDTKGYSASFRVNLKQQTTISAEEFATLSNGTVPPFHGLATSVNLACVDYYPKESGKKNWYVLLNRNEAKSSVIFR